MDSKIILGRILQKMMDKGFSQVEGYNKFGFIKTTSNSVHVTRENGKDTPVPFKKLLIGIEAYQSNGSLYDEGPGKLKDFEIIHVNSPIFSMLHLLRKEDYKL